MDYINNMEEECYNYAYKLLTLEESKSIINQIITDNNLDKYLFHKLNDTNDIKEFTILLGKPPTKLNIMNHIMK
jgi:hypothetical protein